MIGIACNSCTEKYYNFTTQQNMNHTDLFNSHVLVFCRLLKLTNVSKIKEKCLYLALKY